MATDDNQILSIAKRFFWFQGLLFLFLGILAIVVPFIFSVGFAVVTGVLLLIGGVSQLIHSFHVRKLSGFLLSIITAAILIITGLFLLGSPVAGLATITLIIAIFLVIQGIATTIYAIFSRPPGWGWILTSGIVSFLLGLIVWLRWPVSALWFIGIIIGINLILYGISQIAIATSLDKIEEV